ncbi:MAG: hypothetical protein IKU47_08015 [Oscillospiraceae bacterium]|nr:hypothetical protein [Oscillospiraceae bacterium]
MIRTKFGCTSIEGMGSEWQADLSCIIEALAQHYPKEEIMEAVEIGLLSKEEKKARIEEKLKQIKEEIGEDANIFDVLTDILLTDFFGGGATNE